MFISSNQLTKNDVFIENSKNERERNTTYISNCIIGWKLIKRLQNFIKLPDKYDLITIYRLSIFFSLFDDVRVEAKKAIIWEGYFKFSNDSNGRIDLAVCVKPSKLVGNNFIDCLWIWPVVVPLYDNETIRMFSVHVSHSCLVFIGKHAFPKSNVISTLFRKNTILNFWVVDTWIA